MKSCEKCCDAFDQHFAITSEWSPAEPDAVPGIRDKETVPNPVLFLLLSWCFSKQGLQMFGLPLADALLGSVQVPPPFVMEVLQS